MEQWWPNILFHFPQTLFARAPRALAVGAGLRSFLFCKQEHRWQKHLLEPLSRADLACPPNSLIHSSPKAFSNSAFAFQNESRLSSYSWLAFATAACCFNTSRSNTAICLN